MFRWLQSDSPDATKSHTVDPESLFHLWCWVKGILRRILFCLCSIWLILPLAGEQHLVLDPLNISLGLPRGFQLLILIFFSGNPSSIIPYGLMAYTAEEANVVNTILNKEKNQNTASITARNDLWKDQATDVPGSWMSSFFLWWKI